jgi:hypothetical protein
MRPGVAASLCALLVASGGHCLAADGIAQMWTGAERRIVAQEFPQLWVATDTPQGLYIYGRATTVAQAASKTDYGSRYQGSINWELPGAVRLFREGRYGGGMLAWNALGTFISSSSQDKLLHQRIGSDSETYDDIADGEFMIQELWYAHAVGREIYLLGGKLDASNIWDMNAFANTATEDFMAGSLIDSQAVIFPESGAGVNVQAKLADSLLIAAGIQQNNAVENSFNIDDLDLQQLFYGAELHWKTGASDTRAGNYRLLAFYSRKNSKRDQGLSLSADQRVGNVGLFTRLTAADNEINPVSHFVSAGFALFPSPARPNNQLGLGFSWSKVDSGRNETVGELFYRFEINRFLALTPDIQLISNPAFANKSDNVWVANLRLQASF